MCCDVITFMYAVNDTFKEGVLHALIQTKVEKWENWDYWKRRSSFWFESRNSEQAQREITEDLRIPLNQQINSKCKS